MSNSTNPFSAMAKQRKNLTFTEYFAHHYKTTSQLLVGKSQQKPYRDNVKDYLTSITFNADLHDFLQKSGFLTANSQHVIVLEYKKHHKVRIEAHNKAQSAPAPDKKGKDAK